MKKAIVALMMGLLVFTAVPQSVFAADVENASAENNEAIKDEDVSAEDSEAVENASGADQNSESVENENVSAEKIESVKEANVSTENTEAVEEANVSTENTEAVEDENVSAENTETSGNDKVSTESIENPVTVEESQYESAATVPSVVYSTHVQNIGWQTDVSDGAPAGTTGRSLRIEALKIHISGDENLGVTYQAHVQDYGWMSEVSDGAVAGTTGQSRRVEAISINLTGEMSQNYDIYYRTHVQNIGWTGWAKNGANCGSQGGSLRMEALQIKLVPKGFAAPGSTANAFYEIKSQGNSSQASAVLNQVGWNLQAAFNWSAGIKWVKSPTDPALGSRYFANLGFTNHQGNCYVMAATFYEMARTLGYEAHQMTGTVPLRRGGMGPHSWVEVNVGGTYYVCDPDFTNESRKNGYMIHYGQSGTWRYTGYSRMN